MSSTNFEFQRNIPFTEFIENGSWLQRRDPGAYLIGFLFFFTATLITHSWSIIATAFIYCVVGIWLSRIPVSTYIVGLIKAIPFIAIIALLNLFINPIGNKSQIIAQFWIIQISTQALFQSLLLLARFVILMLALSITTANFSVSRFIQGLEDLLKPLTLLDIPVHDFIVAIEISIRYIPILTNIAEKIAKAQASRGGTWGTRGGNITEKFKQVIPIIIPLFMQSFNKADKIALAMDARGYGLGIKRSRYYSGSIKAGDIIFIITVFSLLILEIVLA
jgi:energy-coupling factor transport system permease protein